MRVTLWTARVLLVAAVVPGAAVACDWDPTGVCGGRRWHVWSAEVRILVGCAIGACLLGGMLAPLRLRKLGRSRAVAILPAVLAVAATLSLTHYATDWTNWPAGKPANAPPWAPD